MNLLEELEQRNQQQNNMPPAPSLLQELQPSPGPAVEKSLGINEDYLNKIKPDCDWMLNSFEDR